MKTTIVLFLIFCIAIWTASLYFGWLNEAYIFGKNVYSSILSNHTVDFPKNTSIIKPSQHAYKLLSKVTIPAHITTIQKNAFKGNLLTSITIGENVTLGDNAFGHGFENIYQSNRTYAGTYTRHSPKSKHWTSYYAGFGYQRINGNIAIIDYIGSSGEITIPDNIYGEAITSIATEAFYGKGITGVTLPNSIKSIGVDAFAGNPIIRVSLGANVTLGSNDNNHGILGQATGFNSAYRSNNNSRSGVYTRKSAENTTWSRVARP